MTDQTRIAALEEQISDLLKKNTALEAELLTCRRTCHHAQHRASPGQSTIGSLLLSIIESTSIVIYVKDTDGRYILVNKCFSDLFNRRERDLIGLTPADLFPAEIARQHLQHDAQIIASKQPTTFREQAHFAGSRREFLSDKFPIFNEHGIISAIGGVSTDITEQVETEQRLRLSEEKFRLAFHTSPDSINLNRAEDGMYLDINEGFSRIMGYSRDEVIGKTSLSLNIWRRPEDRQQLVNRLQRNGFVDNLEAEFVFKNGGVGRGLMSARLMQIDGDNVILSITRDITELRRTQQEKERIEQQYRQAQKVEAIGRLAGGVAHDLNNLLSPVIGYSELLLQKLPPEDQRFRPVEHILHAGVRAKDLVHQLLAFSRKQTLEYKPVNLNNAVQEIGRLLRSSIPEDIRIQFSLAPDIETILADTGQIEQVIMNLALNARDAMPQGGRLIFETAMCELDEEYAATHPGVEPGRYAMLCVSDDGCGMNEAIREHLFEPFFSTKQGKGTGLGLSTVHGIVTQHGGSVHVYSEPGEGTTFKVFLPVPLEVPETAAETETAPTRHRGSETILLVEDNLGVRTLAATILKDSGYTVVTAANGEQALQLARGGGQAIDLLLTDVVMPGINGRQLYEQLLATIPTLRVLYMSGYTDNIIAHKGVITPGLAFIQKPFSVKALTGKVRQVLGD
ncbi:MAG: PAS domain S-box protein [Desulfofustis sp.]|nr:PAS domain S-box protein [Desulfofustis sp.]